MTGKKIRDGLWKYAKKEGIPHWNSTTPGERGEPDTKFLFKGNLWVYMEIKGDGDRLSEHQKDRIETYRRYQVPVYVVKSIEEGKEILKWYKTHKLNYPHYSLGNEK